MSLRRVIYTSMPSDGLGTEDINNILQKARTNNSARNVTGLLIFSSNVFIQALEGEEADVAEIMGKIKEDNRHHSIDVVTDAPIDQRVFGDWSMGFSQSTAEKLSAAAEIEGALDPAALSAKLSSSLAFPLMFMQAIIADEHARGGSAQAI